MCQSSLVCPIFSSHIVNPVGVTNERYVDDNKLRHTGDDTRRVVVLTLMKLTQNLEIVDVKGR